MRSHIAPLMRRAPPSIEPSAQPTAAAAERRAERNSQESWEDEGGSLNVNVPLKGRYADRVVSGRIVQKGGTGRPYTVVLTHEDGRTSEHPCATMREGEAFIRRVTPTPPKRDSSRDHAPGNA